MPPKTITWELEPHTLGKHKVLENYMQAWLPIMTSWNGRVLFIDAFAGPGEYSGGEPGSPVIALRSFLNHSGLSRFKGQVHYLFIEKTKARYEHLVGVVGNMEKELPPSCSYEVVNSTFDETLTKALDQIAEQNTNLAPAFVMIDPFGVSGTPMKTVARILESPRSEVYISFMYESMNRFKEHPNFEKHLDELFGCQEWQQGIDLADGKERKDFLYGLYISQLKKHGAKHVVHFELYEGERLVYAIFFGTKNLAGSDKMKQAIWKVTPFGDFKFRGGQLGQLTLGDALIDFGLLGKDLHKEFASKGWQRIEDVLDFVKSDATAFHSGHLKVKTLRPMEAGGKIEVKPDTRNKKGRYPNGTILRFI